VNLINLVDRNPGMDRRACWCAKWTTKRLIKTGINSLLMQPIECWKVVGRLLSQAVVPQDTISELNPSYIHPTPTPAPRSFRQEKERKAISNKRMPTLGSENRKDVPRVTWWPKRYPFCDRPPAALQMLLRRSVHPAAS